MNSLGLKLLKQFEGFREDAYRDAVGVWTIGYGFTKGVAPGQRMTRDEANKRLAEEARIYESAVKAALTRPATPNQLAALTSLFYNVGTGWIKKASIIRAHNAGDIKGVERGFASFCKAGGRVLKGLVRRRAEEFRLYLTLDAGEEAPRPEVARGDSVQQTGKPIAESKTAWAATTLAAMPVVKEFAGGLQGLDPWVAGMLILGVALAGFIVWDRYRKARDHGV